VKIDFGTAIILVLIIFGVIYVYDHSLIFPQSASSLQTQPAVDLANQIKNLPTINDTACNGSSQLISNAATVLQDMDGTLGTGFGKVVQFDASNCDIVLQFVPILGSYNSFVTDSRQLDPNNSTSVTKFYEDAFLLSSDILLLNDKIVYKVAFRATGEINDALKLDKLTSLCGDDCYRAVLSGIHWTIGSTWIRTCASLKTGRERLSQTGLSVLDSCG